MPNPWVKFYTSDWRADPRLRMCSIAARGLWIEMICVMHEATPYGHLLVMGQCPTDAQLAVLAGIPSDQVAALLGELETAGVFSRTREGVIYSRKLSRMAKKAATARNNGRKGGNPTLSKQTENIPLDKGNDKGADKPQKPEARTQSSSSSRSAGAPARDPDPPDDAALTQIPDDGFDLYQAVLKAVGLDSKRISTYWLPPAAVVHCIRWRGLGLFDEEIIRIARESRKNHTEPPAGPKALDRAMQISASVKQAPRLQTSQGGQGNAKRTRTDQSEDLRRSIERAAEPRQGLPEW